jgi:cobalamin biosynthesis protein CbiD
LDRYVIKDGKRLRYGYTTGSCAAAAAKAAAIMLFSGKCVDAVDIDTPKGWRLHLDIEDALLGDGFASCAVRKDGGDDPDVTDGLLIYAYAQHMGARYRSRYIRACCGQYRHCTATNGLPAGNRIPVREIRLAYDMR